MSWREEAACRDKPRDLFFPALGHSPNNLVRKKAEAPAKAVCAGCPVREECLEDALASWSVGVWGGTNEFERRKIRAERDRERLWGADGMRQCADCGARLLIEEFPFVQVGERTYRAGRCKTCFQRSARERNRRYHQRRTG